MSIKNSLEMKKRFKENTMNTSGKNNGRYKHGNYCNKNYCLNCNKEISSIAKRCGSCSSKLKWENPN